MRRVTIDGKIKAAHFGLVPSFGWFLKFCKHQIPQKVSSLRQVHTRQDRSRGGKINSERWQSRTGAGEAEGTALASEESRFSALSTGHLPRIRLWPGWKGLLTMLLFFLF